MPTPVEPGDNRQKNLGRADIGRRLFAPDVLFPRLKCQPIGGATSAVLGDTDETTGQTSHQFLPGRNEPGVGPAVAKRYTKTLRRADRYVGSPLPRRCEHRQGEKVGGDHDESIGLVEGVCDIPVITNCAARTRILKKHTKGERRINVIFQVTHVDSCGSCPGADNSLGRLVTVGIDVEDLAVASIKTTAHRHCLGGGRWLIEEGSVCNVQSSEIRDHCLEVQESLETTLRNLRLIWGVRGVPRRIL